MIPPTSNPRRGEVWLVDFDPSVGAEQRNVRPALVLSVDGVGRLPLRIVVPVTDWKPHYERSPWFTRLSPTEDNGLAKVSGADAFQVKSVSIERFESKLGDIEPEELDNVTAGIALCVGIRFSS